MGSECWHQKHAQSKRYRIVVNKNKEKNDQVLCSLSDIEDLSSKSFSVRIKRKETDIFVIRKDDQVYTYQNVCPHAQAPLEWNPDEFLDEEKENIICALHGAMFSIEDGDCLGGPCEGIGLTAVSVEIQAGEVVLIT